MRNHLKPPLSLKCDCLNYCGDDPWLADGRSQMCEQRRTLLFNERLSRSAADLFHIAKKFVKYDQEDNWDEQRCVEEFNKVIARIEHQGRAAS